MQDAKTASKPATKVELCKIYYAELCGIMALLCRIMLNYAFSGIMRNYAFSGIMRNYAFSGRIMHLHNRLNPDNEDT